MEVTHQDFFISNLFEEKISLITQEIQKKRMFIINEKIKEKTGLEINFEQELGRLFKRFCIVTEGNKQTIFFNDGSIKGMRIITFVTKEIPFDSENLNLGYEETYY